MTAPSVRDTTVYKGLDANNADLGGVYYYDIEYIFSEPLTFYFDSPYLAFTKYIYTNGGTKVELKNHKTNDNTLPGASVCTNNSAITLSFSEYTELSKVASKDGIVVLHCFATENTKQTSLEFEFEDAKFNLQVAIGSTDPEIYQTSGNADIVYDGTAEGQKGIPYTFTYTDPDTSETKSFSITARSRTSGGKYYIDLIYSQDLILKNARFSVTLTNFVKTKQYSDWTDEYFENMSAFYIAEMPEKNLMIKKAYCENKTQTVQSDPANPTKYSWNLGTFANQNTIIIESEVYYFVMFSTNKLKADNTSPIQLVVRSYGESDRGVEYFVNETVTVRNRYAYAYVRQGDLVYINANMIPDWANSPVIFYHTTPATGLTKSEMAAAKVGNTSIPANNIYNLLTTDIYNVTTSYQTYITNGKLSAICDDTNLSNGLTSSKTRFEFLPENNIYYLADYYGCTTNSSFKLFGIIAPNNSSKFDRTSGIGQTIIETTTHDGSTFKVLVYKIEVGQGISFKHVVDVNAYNFSSYKVIEQNGNLYTSESDTEYRSESIRFKDFTVSKDFIAYAFNGEVKQYMLLSKVMTNCNGAEFGYYKQRIIAAEKAKDIDYIYVEDVVYTPDDTGSSMFGVNGEISSMGTVTTHKFKAQDNITVHAASLRYYGKLFYFMDGSIYIIDEEDYTILEDYNPKAHGLYFNINYDDYSIDVYKIKYVFTGGDGFEYHFENVEGVDKLWSRTAGSTNALVEVPKALFYTYYNSDPNNSNNICLHVSKSGTGSVDVKSDASITIAGITVEHFDAVDEVPLTGNFAKKGVRVNIYDNSFDTVYHDGSKLADVLTPDDNNPEITVTYNYDVDKSVVLSRLTLDGEKYYFVGGGLYKDYTDLSTEDNTSYDIFYNSATIANVTCTPIYKSEEDGATVHFFNRNSTKYYYYEGSLYSTFESGVYSDKVEESYVFTNPFYYSDAGQTTKVMLNADEERVLIEYFNSVEINDTLYFVDKNMNLFIDFPYTQANKVGEVSEEITDTHSYSEADFLKGQISEYKVYPQYLILQQDGESIKYSFKDDTDYVSKSQIKYYDVNDNLLTLSYLEGRGPQIKNGSGVDVTDDVSISVDYNVVYKLKTNFYAYPTAIDHNSIDYTPSIASDTLVFFNSDYIEYVGSDSSKIYYHKTLGSVHVYDLGMMRNTQLDYRFTGEMMYYYDEVENNTSFTVFARSKTIDESKTETIQPGNGELNVNYSRANITQIKAKVYEGYYIKGFYIIPEFVSDNTFWLNYQLDPESTPPLTGLQNKEYYSKLNMGLYISIDYETFASASNSPITFTYDDNGFISYVNMNLNIPIKGQFRVYVVYAAIIYTVDVTRVNVKDLDNVDDATISLQDKGSQKGLYSQLFKEYPTYIVIDYYGSDRKFDFVEYDTLNSEVRYNDGMDDLIVTLKPFSVKLNGDDFTEYVTEMDSTVYSDAASVGSVSGCLLVEHMENVWLKARAKNGNSLLGYSLNSSSITTNIQTYYSDEELKKLEDLTDEQYTELVKLSNSLTNNNIKNHEGIDLTNKYFMNQDTVDIIEGENANLDKIKFLELTEGYNIKFSEENNSLKKNHIVFKEVTDDIGMYVYFNAVFYNLHLEIAEMEEGSFYVNESEYKKDAYLSYSEYLTNNDSWQNPADEVKTRYNGYNDNYFYEYDTEAYSIGKYKEQSEATGSSNQENIDYYYNHALISTGKATAATKSDNISEDATDANPTPTADKTYKYQYKPVNNKDIFVYTLFDNYGSTIVHNIEDTYYATPTKIMASSINFKLSAQYGFLVYNPNADGGIYVPSLFRDVIGTSDTWIEDSDTKMFYYKEPILDGSGKQVVDEFGVPQFNYWVKQTFYVYTITGTDSTTEQITNDSTANEHNVTTAKSKKTPVEYKYLAIPYSSYGESAVEYSVSCMDSMTNRSEGMIIDGTDNQIVHANTKHVYSIYTPKNFGEVSQQTSQSNRVYKVDYKDVEFVTVSGYNILVFKEKINGQTYVVAPKYYDNSTPLSENMNFYTLDYVRTIINAYKADKNNTDNKDRYSKLFTIDPQGGNMVILSSEIDSTIARNIIYSASSTNVSDGIANIDEYIVTSGGKKYLKEGLFTISFDGLYVLGSGDFHETDKKGVKLIARLKENQGSAIMVDNSYSFKTTMSITSENFAGVNTTIIHITMKISYINGSLPSVKINSNPDQSLHKSLTGVGQMVDFDYDADNSHTYKPILTESEGTRYSTNTTSDSKTVNSFDDDVGAEDSNYIHLGAQIGSYFENLYSATTSSDGKTSDYFELPNLNVKTTLIYSHKVLPVEVDVSFASSSITNYAGSGGSNATTLEVLHKGKNSIYSSNQTLTRLFTRVLRSDWKERLNMYEVETYRTKQDNWTYYDTIYKSYYMYIISDAYYVVEILNSIAANRNLSNEVRSRAIELYSYITTFNPLDYDEDDEKNKEYLFDDDKNVSNDMLTYNELRTFIATYAPDQVYKLPNGLKQFMKITTIDIASMMEKAIDINFIYNHFRQTDLVISSFELNEMFYIQRYIARKSDAVYDSLQGYNFFFDVQSSFDQTFASNAYTVSTGTPISTAVGSEDTEPKGSNSSNPIKDIDKMAQELAPFYQFSQERASSHNYFAFTYSSLALTEQNFYGEKDISVVNCAVTIRTDACLKTYFYSKHPSYTTKDMITTVGLLASLILTVAASCMPWTWAVYACAGLAYGVMVGIAIYNGVATYNTSKRASETLTNMRNTLYYEGIPGYGAVFDTGDKGEISGVNRIPKDAISDYIETKLPDFQEIIDQQKG